MKTIIAATGLLALAGCSLSPGYRLEHGCGPLSAKPDTARLSTAHYSHLSAGFPFGPKNEEDALTLLNMKGNWKCGSEFFEAGIGINIAGKNGGGFYGPSEVVGFEYGYEFSLR